MGDLEKSRRYSLVSWGNLGKFIRELHGSCEPCEFNVGELDSDLHAETTMSRKNRIIVNIKPNSFEKDKEAIMLMLSSKENYRRARAKLMQEIIADDMDIDT